MQDEDQIRQAYEAGRSAHANARGLDSCPIFALGQLGQPWRDAWHRGWNDADAASGYLRSPRQTPETGSAVPIRKGRTRRR